MDEHVPHTLRAIELARQAREMGNHPFGAVLVAEGQVVLEARNTVVTGNNPTQHAELNLVQLAWDTLTPDVIRASTLYASTEPCPMCTGAIFWSGIRRVVYSFPAIELGLMANDRFCGPCRELFDRADQTTEVVGPVLPADGRQVHEGFWTSTAAQAPGPS